MTTSIDIAELKNRLEGGESITLLDVRRKADTDANPRYIAGAAYRNPEKINEWVKALPAGKPAVVYCVKGGSVSQMRDRTAAQGGHRGRLPGGRAQGMDGWRPSGGECTQWSTLSRSTLPTSICCAAPVSPRRTSPTASRWRKRPWKLPTGPARHLDFELVGRGALFHDLGKAKTHEIEHGKIGAEMGAALGLPAAVTAVMEKHIRGGLSEAEAVELGLPVKDYTLGTLEERIIIYADRLVDIITDGIVTIHSEWRPKNDLRRS